VQKMKMSAKGRRMGVWIHTLGSIPYLSSLASGNLSDVVLHAHTTCSAYPSTDKRAQVPLISWHWTAKWWCSGAKTESPRIPYTRHPIGSGIVVMIASGPVIPVDQ
jgi:hypothetical protein